VFFYELHEGDNEVFSDVLVVSESEWEPDEFFELVQTIRRRIQDGYIHDTLSEAIAVELERDHAFIHISDDRLVASVNVSTDDEQNFLAELEVDSPTPRKTRTMMTTIPSRISTRARRTAPSSPNSIPTGAG
jgi:phosphatidate phosphatase APP1